MDPRECQYIEKLYLEMYEKLAYYCNLTLQDPVLSEEAVQETFQIACQHPRKLMTSSNPQGWIFNTMKNVIFAIRREQRRTNMLLSKCLLTQYGERSYSEDSFSPELLFGNVADTEEFRLLWKMAAEGKSQQELAGELGITAEACRKRVQRARQTLKRKIKI